MARGNRARRLDDLMIEAATIVNGARQADYGTPENSLAAIADMWNALLRAKLAPGCRVSSDDVARLMVALKLARDTNKPKRDNIVDAHGYLVMLGRSAGYATPKPFKK